MTLPTLRPLSVGEILDLSFTLYRRHFGPLATVTLACSGLPFVLGLFLQSAGGFWTNPLLTLGYYALTLILSAVATAATVFVISESYLGRRIGAGEALTRAMPLIGRLVLLAVLFGSLAFLGLLLLVVPGVVIVCGLILSTPALVLEPGTRATTALGRAWRLSRGARLRIFGLLLTLFVLLYIPAAAVGGLTAWLLPNSAAAGLVMLAVAGLIQLFMYPFFYCVLTIAYYDLRVRKEGFDLELLAATLQPA